MVPPQQLDPPQESSQSPFTQNCVPAEAKPQRPLLRQNPSHFSGQHPQPIIGRQIEMPLPVSPGDRDAVRQRQGIAAAKLASPTYMLGYMEYQSTGE